MTKQWFYIAEAAKRLNCSVRTLQRKAQTGEVIARQVPGKGASGLVWQVDISNLTPMPRKAAAGKKKQR